MPSQLFTSIHRFSTSLSYLTNSLFKQIRYFSTPVQSFKKQRQDLGLDTSAANLIFLVKFCSPQGYRGVSTSYIANKDGRERNTSYVYDVNSELKALKRGYDDKYIWVKVIILR